VTRWRGTRPRRLEQLAKEPRDGVTIQAGWSRMSNQQHLARRKIAFVVLTGTTKWLHVRLQLFGLTLEPGQPVRASNNRSRQHLDGDRPLQVGVGGLVDLAHATHADLGDNFIRPRRVPGVRANSCGLCGRNGGEERIGARTRSDATCAMASQTSWFVAPQVLRAFRSAWSRESSFGKAKIFRSLGVVPFCTGGRGLVNRLTNIGTVLGAIEYARGSRWESGATTVR
jgi:hypothetical protein